MKIIKKVKKCEKWQKTSNLAKKGGSDPPPKTEDQHKQNCFKGRTEIVFRPPGGRVNPPLIRGGGAPPPRTGVFGHKIRLYFDQYIWPFYIIIKRLHVHYRYTGRKAARLLSF